MRDEPRGLCIANLQPLRGAWLHLVVCVSLGCLACGRSEVFTPRWDRADADAQHSDSGEAQEEFEGMPSIVKAGLAKDAATGENWTKIDAGTGWDAEWLDAKQSSPDAGLELILPCGPPISVPSISSIQAKLQFGWRGVVTTPWVDPYAVNVRFLASTYSAHSVGVPYPAFYYGSDADSTRKTYEVRGVDQRGYGELRIAIRFDTEALRYGEIDDLVFCKESTQVEFNFWDSWNARRGGPIHFALLRD